MTDREKIIKGLECCAREDIGDCNNCPYNKNTQYCDIDMMREAIVALKAQEAVSVQKKQMEMVGLQTWDWACGNCGQTVLFSANFCPWCGRAVKWDG